MTLPTKRHEGIIKHQIRGARIRARRVGVELELEDLWSIGLETFLRAQKNYKTTRNASFETYLHHALAHTYADTFKREYRWSKTKVLYDPEKHEGAVLTHAEEVNLMGLVQLLISQLPKQIDKEVLVERVFPSATTFTLAVIEAKRAEYLREQGMKVKCTLEVTPWVLAKSLRVPVWRIHQSMVRINKLIKATIGE